MAGLLTNSNVDQLTGLFNQHFLTFAINPIIVNKEPIQIISNTGSYSLPGYGLESNESNITYIPQNQTFSGIVKYSNPEGSVSMTDLKFTIPLGGCQIKVNRDCYNYIAAGKTENIQVNNLTYNVISEPKIQNYLGLQFWYFLCENSK